jgi:hypothetical protein
MGCVFLEMATVLLGRSLNDLEVYYATHGTTSRYFYKNEEATEGWINELSSGSDPDEKEVLEWTRSMLKESQTERPTASQIVAKIADTPSEYRYFCFNCLEDAPTSDASRQKFYNISNSDIVNGAILQSYLRRDSVLDTDSEDDTVTSKILEEKGVVSVATEVEHLDDAVEVEIVETFPGEPDIPPASHQHVPNRSLEASPNKPIPIEQHTRADKTREFVTHDDSTPSRMASGVSLRSSIKTPGKPSAAKEVRFGQKHSNEEHSTSSGRFSGLTADRRPLPSEPPEDPVDLDEMPIIAPEPLIAPPLDSQTCYPLPRATLVPSYVLAGSNRFSMKEVRGSDITMGSHNLFVYGRLMFPSVLRAFAARSTQGQGVYSPMHQRRLVPTSSDWANADVSVKNAAEAMTPAKLKDYDAWRPSRMECAAIQHVSRTSSILRNRSERGIPSLEATPSGEVVGFLILGVTEEVLRYCDLVFTSDAESLKRAQRTSEEGGSASHVDGLLQRKLVAVDVQLTSGEYRSLPANTYVWSKGTDHLRHPWRPEAFVRSGDFQNMSHVDGSDWRGEEMMLSKTMKVAYALAGDELCSAIISNDMPKLKNLIDDYRNVDARCRKYGTPLQAAVSTGNDEFVRLLLAHGANPSSKGGKYGSPLIAATVGKRRAITRILLKHRADIFTSHPQYVNALYQAVGSTDYALTEMLLEGGAWLSKDYGEIRDLAIEKRDRELQDLLVEYDVRDAYENPLEERHVGNQPERKHREDVGFLRRYGPVTKAVLRKFVVVSGESGSLRGRKGVAITRAALEAGAPPMILDLIRNAIDPVMKLIDMLKAADKQEELKQKSAVGSTGRVEELDSDEGECELNDQGMSPTTHNSRSGKDITIPVLDQSSSPLSRNSSTSSMSSSRSSSSGEFQHPRKHVKFEENVGNTGAALKLPLRTQRDVSPKDHGAEGYRIARDSGRDTSSSHSERHSGYRSPTPQDPGEPRCRPIVPQIITPSSGRLPLRRPSVVEQVTPSRSSRQMSPVASPKSPQYLVSTTHALFASLA